VTRDIILFSTADWDNPFWTNKQHMAAHLALEGYRVLYVESVGLRRPTAGRSDFRRVLRRLKKSLGGLRKVRENIWVYSPIAIPFHGSAAARNINRTILVNTIKFHSRSIGFKEPVFFTYNPMSLDIAQRLGPSMVVYHCVDDLSATPGTPTDAIRSEEARLIKGADLVFTTSPKLQEACSGMKPEDTHFFPNVVDFDLFSMALEPGKLPDDISKIPGPRIGFVGAVSDYKVDFDLVSEVARKRSDWHWVFIGEVGEGQPGTSVDKLKLPNIHLLGPRRYEDLPDYLRGIDVAAIPSPLTDYTASMFPMKFFEYLAAGRSVVATDLPSLNPYAEACTLVDSPEGFISAVEDILKGSGDVPDVSVGIELAKRHTWKWRLGEMLRIMSEKWEQLR
jgi:glycosyltransferase involved in cell wall biosynthesis